MKYLDQWQIQRGSLWQVPPQTAVVPALKWRPSDENAPLFGVYRSRNKRKITQSKPVVPNLFHLATPFENMT